MIWPFGNHDKPRKKRRTDIHTHPDVPGWEVLYWLGGGGNADVYAVRPEGGGATVALKVQRPDAHANPWLRVHFHQEFSILRTFNHPNIARAYHLDHLPYGRGYFTLEYCPGGTLKEWAWQRRQTEEDLSPEKAAEIGLIIARALDYAHCNGVIHRDLKLQNVAVASGGVLKIIDFGVAKTTDGWGLTPDCAHVGTRGRTPPNDPTSLATPALDVFSIGVLVYELLTGQVPSQHETIRGAEDPALRPGWSLRHLRTDVPLELDRIIQKCLQTDEKDRYPTARQLARALQAFLSRLPSYMI
jgi:serine/threonine protein kinase